MHGAFNVKPMSIFHIFRDIHLRNNPVSIFSIKYEINLQQFFHPCKNTEDKNRIGSCRVILKLGD